MVNSVKTKTVTAVPSKAAPVVNKQPVATNAAKTLTVVVLDDKSQPTAGAQVSITPSNFSGTTNGAGEIQFQLGGANKYNITASYGSNTVTVPYYVTENGATRLVVNPIYVKTVEKERSQVWGLNAKTYSTVGVVLGIIIVIYLILKFLRRRKRQGGR